MKTPQMTANKTFSSRRLDHYAEPSDGGGSQVAAWHQGAQVGGRPLQWTLKTRHRARLSVMALATAAVLAPNLLSAGISKQLQDAYVRQYENKTLFLKKPIRGAGQIILVQPTGAFMDRSNAAQALSFLVGERIRVARLDFKDRSIEFHVAAIESAHTAVIVFRFPTELVNSFQQKPQFDQALADTFTEGLSYLEVEAAKEEFIKDEFNQQIQLASVITGTTPDFVRSTVVGQLPEVADLQGRLEEKETELARIKQDLSDREAEVSKLRQDVQQLTSRAARAEGDTSTLQSQNRALAQKNRDLENEVGALKADNERFQQQISRLEAQINSVAEKLNFEKESKTELGQKLESLSENIDALQTERTGLSQKLTEVGRELTDLQQTNSRLEKDLADARQRGNRLQRDLNSLTEDRDGLASRYLTTRKERDGLLTSNLLREALRLERRDETRPEGPVRVGDLYLNAHQIATLAVTHPLDPVTPVTITFTAASPETVQFSEEERGLYEHLGEAFEVETAWSSAPNTLLKPRLVTGEAVQKIPTRETATWQWSFQGFLDEPVAVDLIVKLTDAGGSIIRLPNLKFEVLPTGLLNRLLYRMSPTSVGLGAVGGGLLVGVLMLVLRGRTKKTPRRPGERKVSLQKEL